MYGIVRNGLIYCYLKHARDESETKKMFDKKLRDLFVLKYHTRKTKGYDLRFAHVKSILT